MGRGEFWSILVPDIKGGNSPLCWGEQLFSGGAFYFGAILISLFMVSLILRRDVLVGPCWWWRLLAIVLSWRDASGLTDFFLDSVPGFAKFRDTKMMLMLINACCPSASDSSFAMRWPERSNGGRNLFIAAGAGGLLLVFAVAPTAFAVRFEAMCVRTAGQLAGTAFPGPAAGGLQRGRVAQLLGLVLLAMGGLLAIVRLRAMQPEKPRAALSPWRCSLSLPTCSRWTAATSPPTGLDPHRRVQVSLHAIGRRRGHPRRPRAAQSRRPGGHRGRGRPRRADYDGRIGKREERVLDAARFSGLQTVDHFRVLNLRGSLQRRHRRATSTAAWAATAPSSAATRT